MAGSHGSKEQAWWQEPEAEGLHLPPHAGSTLEVMASLGCLHQGSAKTQAAGHTGERFSSWII